MTGTKEGRKEGDGCERGKDVLSRGRERKTERQERWIKGRKGSFGKKKKYKKSRKGRKGQGRERDIYRGGRGVSSRGKE